jgi:hypothetical protein
MIHPFEQTGFCFETPSGGRMSFETFLRLKDEEDV